jgi:gamma-glutamylputrescine oxidase
VVVVGGGVTGCAAALRLAEAGLNVCLHDAREIAGGASGRNGGFALRGGAAPFDVTVETIGRENTVWLWRQTEAALDRLEELAGDALRRDGSLRLAADEEERDELAVEPTAASRRSGSRNPSTAASAPRSSIRRTPRYSRPAG